MNLADVALRSIVRAAAWRSVLRVLPVWVSFLILAAVIVFGGRV